MKGKQLAGTPTVADNLTQAFEFLFGCWHRNLSRPFTLSGWKCKACLRCGKPFARDHLTLVAKSNSAESENPRYADRLQTRVSLSLSRASDSGPSLPLAGIGRLEAVNLGTLFLDRVGDIPQELQPKLITQTVLQLIE
jgi:hypothetical protein